MKVYKLVRKRKDNTLAPLFIEAKRTLPLGEFLQAYCTPTKGYARRPGFHSTFVPYAPHLSTDGRVWVECTVPGKEYKRELVPHLFTGRNGMERVPEDGWYRWPRPTKQGGEWIVSSHLRIDRILSFEEAAAIAGR
jgi:hypothetical protein